MATLFLLLTFSLKQPKLLFKMPPLEDASQTAMKNQKEAQFGEKAVKYFIGRLFRILGTGVRNTSTLYLSRTYR